jgi:hypothetical protein
MALAAYLAVLTAALSKMGAVIRWRVSTPMKSPAKMSSAVLIPFYIKDVKRESISRLEMLLIISKTAAKTRTGPIIFRKRIWRVPAAIIARGFNTAADAGLPDIRSRLPINGTAASTNRPSSPAKFRITATHCRKLSNKIETMIIYIT